MGQSISYQRVKLSDTHNEREVCIMIVIILSCMLLPIFFIGIPIIWGLHSSADNDVVAPMIAETPNTPQYISQFILDTMKSNNLTCVTVSELSNIINNKFHLEWSSARITVGLLRLVQEGQMRHITDKKKSYYALV